MSSIKVIPMFDGFISTFSIFLKTDNGIKFIIDLISHMANLNVISPVEHEIPKVSLFFFLLGILFLTTELTV